MAPPSADLTHFHSGNKVHLRNDRGQLARTSKQGHGMYLGTATCYNPSCLCVVQASSQAVHLGYLRESHPRVGQQPALKPKSSSKKAPWPGHPMTICRAHLVVTASPAVQITGREAHLLATAPVVSAQSTQGPGRRRVHRG